jgi:hypothetical protein
MPQEHTLKTWPTYYDAIARGEKPFDVRRAPIFALIALHGVWRPFGVVHHITAALALIAPKGIRHHAWLGVHGPLPRSC